MMEAESRTPEHDANFTAPITGAEVDAENGAENNAEAATDLPEEERSRFYELHQAFPELTGSEKAAEKAIVSECLQQLVDSEKMSLETLRSLAGNGIIFASEDKIVPPHHQVAGAKEQQLSAAESSPGVVIIFPDFFTDKFGPPDDVSTRANILNHELGHLLHLRAVTVQETNAEGVTTERVEAVVHLPDYAKKFLASYEAHPYWQHAYVTRQKLDGNKMWLAEAVAQDVADYLSSTNVEDWIQRRLKNTPVGYKEDGAQWSRREIIKRYNMGLHDDPEIAAFISHAREVWQFIDSQMKQKSGLAEVRPVVETQDSEEDRMEDENWFSYPDIRGNTHTTPSAAVDMNFLDKMYSKLFGLS